MARPNAHFDDKAIVPEEDRKNEANQVRPRFMPLMHPSQQIRVRRTARITLGTSRIFCLTICVAAVCLAQHRHENVSVPAAVSAYFNAERERIPAFVRDIEVDLGDSLVNPVPELTGWVQLRKLHNDAIQDMWVVSYRIGYLNGTGSIPVIRSAIVDNRGQLIARFPEGRTGENVYVVAPSERHAALVGFVTTPNDDYPAILSVWTVGKEPRKLYQFAPNGGFAPHTALRIVFADLNDDDWADALIERVCRDFDAGLAWREYQVCYFDAEAGTWAYPLSIRGKDFRSKLARADQDAARVMIDVPGPPYETSFEDHLVWKAE